MILYRAKKICLYENERYNYDCYLYEHDGKKECITAEECEIEKGRYAYFELLICSNIPPAEDGNFVKRIDHVHSCGYQQIDSYNVTLVLYLSDVAKCISKAMCWFGKPNGVASYIYDYWIERVEDFGYTID